MRKKLLAIAALRVAAAIAVGGCKSSSNANTGKPGSPAVTHSPTSPRTTSGGGGWA